MTYEISLLPREQCILVRHEGEVTEAEVRAGMDDIFKIANESGARRLLIDWRSASSVPGAGEFWHVMQSKLGEVKVRRNLRRAIIVRPEQRWTAELIVDFAEHRRLSFRVFEDDTEALCWLTESNEPTRDDA